MVFCYKMIMESPRKSVSISLRKKSPNKGICPPSPASELIRSMDGNISGNVLDSIPERDWRLLAVLARKRIEDEKRDRLAEQFRMMWLKEKQERQMIDAESSEEFKRYLHQKRARERSCYELKQFHKSLEQNLKTGELINCIRSKEQRVADLMALNDDRKMSQLVDKALEEEFRAHLAADRRTRQRVADERRRTMQLLYAQRRENDAAKRRTDMLRNASQRVAITNALSSWESELLRRDIAAKEATARAYTMARAAGHDARSYRLSRDRDLRVRRARQLATFTAQLRDAVRSGRL